MGQYTVFLLQSFTIRGKEVEVNTIQGYLRTVNAFYKKKKLQEPWIPKDDSDALQLIETKKKFQEVASRRKRLTDAMCVRMYKLAKDNANSLGFQSAAWNYTAVGRYGGFRVQEFCMDSKYTIGYYVLPDGTYVVRAFTVKNLSVMTIWET